MDEEDNGSASVDVDDIGGGDDADDGLRAGDVMVNGDDGDVDEGISDGRPSGPEVLGQHPSRRVWADLTTSGSRVAIPLPWRCSRLGTSGGDLEADDVGDVILLP